MTENGKAGGPSFRMRRRWSEGVGRPFRLKKKGKRVEGALQHFFSVEMRQFFLLL